MVNCNLFYVVFKFAILPNLIDVWAAIFKRSNRLGARCSVNNVRQLNQMLETLIQHYKFFIIMQILIGNGTFNIPISSIICLRFSISLRSRFFLINSNKVSKLTDRWRNYL